PYRAMLAPDCAASLPGACRRVRFPQRQVFPDDWRQVLASRPLSSLRTGSHPYYPITGLPDSASAEFRTSCSVVRCRARILVAKTAAIVGFSSSDGTTTTELQRPQKSL